MRILIADDDPVSLLRLEAALTDWGYEVTTARDGREAWEILRREDAPPLAILDWVMPGLDGLEVCRRVRRSSEAPFIYLVMLTGKSDRRDLIQGMEAGADDYVSKPFDERELLVRLRAGRRIVELQESLRLQATRDALTGIRNRGAILETLRRESARAAHSGGPIGVIMADLDRFKWINDTFGHPAGDAVLREAASRIAAAIRPGDALGRYGGEEFLIVLPGCGQAGIQGVAERVRGAVSASPVETPVGPVSVTLSLGAAASGGPWPAEEDLIRLADEALYRAKAAGRNRVELADNPGAGGPAE